jgi:hypothetical protein
VSPQTLEYYDGMVLPFLDWLDGEGMQHFSDLDVEHVRRGPDKHMPCCIWKRQAA